MNYTYTVITLLTCVELDFVLETPVQSIARMILNAKPLESNELMICIISYSHEMNDGSNTVFSTEVILYL